MPPQIRKLHIIVIDNYYEEEIRYDLSVAGTNPEVLSGLNHDYVELCLNQGWTKLRQAWQLRNLGKVEYKSQMMNDPGTSKPNETSGELYALPSDS